MGGNAPPRLRECRRRLRMAGLPVRGPWQS